MKKYTLKKQQEGAALLLMTVILLAIILGTVLGALNTNSHHLRRQQNIQLQLLMAKESLLAYSMLTDVYGLNPDLGPGYLICPDTDNDSVPDSPCPVASIGRLTRNLLTPSSGTYSFISKNAGGDSQFWLAISDDFREMPTGIVNTSTASTLSLNGETGILAVIIAPGDVLESQIRPSNNPTNYLEGVNTSGPDFITGRYNSDINNDLMVAITRSDLMTMVTARVAGLIKTQFDTIYPINGNSYPTQLEFQNLSFGIWPSWFNDNNWQLPANTAYNFISNDSVELVFSNCNIVFTIDINQSSIIKRPLVPTSTLTC